MLAGQQQRRRASQQHAGGGGDEGHHGGGESSASAAVARWRQAPSDIVKFVPKVGEELHARGTLPWPRQTRGVRALTQSQRALRRSLAARDGHA